MTDVLAKMIRVFAILGVTVGWALHYGVETFVTATSKAAEIPGYREIIGAFGLLVLFGMSLWAALSVRRASQAESKGGD